MASTGEACRSHRLPLRPRRLCASFCTTAKAIGILDQMANIIVRMRLDVTLSKMGACLECACDVRSDALHLHAYVTASRECTRKCRMRTYISLHHVYICECIADHLYLCALRSPSHTTVATHRSHDGLPPVLIVTDLDGTYIGDESAISELNDCWQRQCVYSSTCPSVFVYNTGRSWYEER